MSKLAGSLVFFLLIGGCAGYQEYQRARMELSEGRVEDGLRSLEEATKQAPLNAEYRVTLLREREKAVNQHLLDFEQAMQRGDLPAAESSLRIALQLDPNNPRAVAGSDRLRMVRQQNQWIDEAEALLKQSDVVGAQARLAKVLEGNPSHPKARELRERIREGAARRSMPGQGLREAYRKPVTLEFRDTALRSVFELLSRASGLNFMFDKDVKPDLRATIFVRNTSLEEAIRYLLVTNQLEQRVLNENTILIYPNTAAKQREYQELVVRSFYLGNSDVKRTLEMLKTIVKAKDIYVDERLNLVVMRDTPDAVRLAQRLIENQDMAEPEVMLELEVLEVGTNKLLELGIRYPDSVSASVSGAAGTPGSLRLSELQQFNSGMVTLTFNNPLVIANLRRTVTEQNLLANPRVRVRNREKAKIHIGEKVPVITTTSTANVGISESVSYLDVGLKLEIEPNIHLENDVAMKVGLEVSSILGEVTRASGLQTYRLGTRHAATVLRLRDNETQILAGLIQQDERSSATRVPGLGDIPVLGRLFSSQSDNNTKTEIVLLITPRVIRNIGRISPEAAMFSSGTEGAIGSAGLTLNQQSPAPPSAAPAATSVSVPAPIR
jgi:general secretion pathway protein D